MGIFDVGRNHSLSGPGISARGAPVGHAGDLDSTRLRPFGAIASTQNRGRGRVFIFMRSIDVVINGDFLGPPVTALGAFVRTPRWFCYSGLGRIALSLLIGLLFFIELLGFRLVQRDGLGAGMDVVVDFVDVVLRAPLPRPTAPACCALVGPAGQFLVAPLGAFDSFGQFWGEAYAMLSCAFSSTGFDIGHLLSLLPPYPHFAYSSCSRGRLPSFLPPHPHFVYSLCRCVCR